MKNKILFTLLMVLISFAAAAQVTQINSNKSLQFTQPLTTAKSVFVSAIDQHLWATNGTLAGTIELSPTITYVSPIGSKGFFDGKFIFAGNTAATGTELYITDGTPAGTTLLSDIVTGPTGSNPAESALLNGFVYFTAETPTQGRELWRTDGTPGGTSFVKDIVTGPNGSNYQDAYHLFSAGSYLLFMARTPSSGVELWRSDGTDAGTILLKDINPGPDSSAVQFFQPFSNMVLFSANDGSHGIETWKTNGTAAGTTILKDIHPGAPGSAPLFGATFYFNFNGHAFFTADDGTNGEELWGTDGTEANTILIKNIEPGPLGSLDFVASSVIVGNKFFFSSTNLIGTRYEIWQSDGTPAGTTLFKSFETNPPFLFPPYSYTSFPLTQVLFQGNKFFFMATTMTEGNELWVSDGTIANTHIVKDIYSGELDGIDLSNISYLYTASTFFFAANDGTHGNELWKTDGSSANTTMVADIITDINGSDPDISPFIVNNKVVFGATNGDDPVARDLYAVDGNFLPLPLALGGFTVIARVDDALLNWYTLQESNTRDFTIQRSFDGSHFENIGVVGAAGTSTNRHDYTFTDAGILKNMQKIIYYRLRSTDNDGKTNYSKIISLKTKEQAWDAHIITNPVINDINISLTGVQGDVNIYITDVSGRIVYNNKYSNTESSLKIPSSQLPHGVYVLQVVYGGEIQKIRFMK